MKLLSKIFRLFLGFLFILSSFLKGVDPVGTSLVIEEWMNALSVGFLSFASVAASVALIALEFVTGCALVLGVKMRFFCRVALYMMLFFTLSTIYAVIFNPVSECGCFGDAFPLTNVQSLLKNIVLLAAAVQIYLYYRYSKSRQLNDVVIKWQNVTVLGGNRVETAIVIFYSALILTLEMWSLLRAPVEEWGPFRIGTDLHTSTLVPEGKDRLSSQASYSDADDTMWGDDSQTQEQMESDLLYVYEKDGVRQEFSIDMLPDTTWRFVEVVQREESAFNSFLSSVLTPKPRPELYFPLRDLSGYFITPLIVSNYSNLVFISIHDIKRLSERRAGELVELARKINGTTGYRCFIVCAASSDEILERFSGGTGGVVLTGDYRTLLSLSRINGGAVVVNSSIIISKTGSLLRGGVGSCSGEELMQILLYDRDEVEIDSFLYATTFVQVFLVGVLATLYLLAVMLRRQRKQGATAMLPNPKKSFEN